MVVAGELTLYDIINRKLQFVNKSEYFNTEEYKLYNEGETLAYKLIMEDLIKFDTNNFINKYIKIIININAKIALTVDEEEKEWLAGYNNAVISVLELIDPVYKYKDLG